MNKKIYNEGALIGNSDNKFKEEIPMPNIVLTRIDNRLVHGQVATQWCGAIGAAEGSIVLQDVSFGD